MQEIINRLGNFGRYQAMLFTLIFIPGFLGGSTTLMFSWTGFSPNVRCCIPEIDGHNCSGKYNDVFEQNLTHLFVKDAMCQRCDVNTTEQCTKEKGTFCRDLGTIYDEDTALVKDSVAILFDIECDYVWMKRMLWSLNTLGFLIGAGLFSVLSDIYGRRPIMLLCAGMYWLITQAAPFFTNFYLFGIGQVLIGCINYVMELVGGMPRTFCGLMYQGFFTCGMLYDGLLAYLINRWQWLQWLSGIPTYLFILFYWFFPESIRWLVANDRPEEAKKYVLKAAKMNGVEIPDSVLEKELQKSDECATAYVYDLFRHWRLAKNTLIVWFSWFATSMSFFGLAQNTADLPGSPYFTYTMSALVELPAYLISVPITEYWGRKPGLVLSFGIGGIACILAGVLDEVSPDWVIIMLALIGKACVSASFAIIYNYAAEMFPTVVRQSGTGFSSVCARIGSLLAPQIRLIGDYVDRRIPIVIYGIIALAAAILDLFLPETKGELLPESIEDGKYFGTDEYHKRMESREAKWMPKAYENPIMKDELKESKF